MKKYTLEYIYFGYWFLVRSNFPNLQAAQVYMCDSSREWRLIDNESKDVVYQEKSGQVITNKISETIIITRDDIK